MTRAFLTYPPGLFPGPFNRSLPALQQLCQLFAFSSQRMLYCLQDDLTQALDVDWDHVSSNVGREVQLQLLQSLAPRDKPVGICKRTFLYRMNG
jgi:hypothetical protein